VSIEIMMVSIDDEWKQFLMQQNNDDGSNWNQIMIPEISSEDNSNEESDSDSEYSDEQEE
jgi:hypothetical protein